MRSLLSGMPNEMKWNGGHFISFETGFSFSQKKCKLVSKFVAFTQKIWVRKAHWFPTFFVKTPRVSDVFFLHIKTPLVSRKKSFSKNQNPTEKRKKTFLEKPKKYQNPISIPPKKRHLRQKNQSWYLFYRFFIVEKRKRVSNEMKWNEASFHFISFHLGFFHFIWHPWFRS